MQAQTVRTERKVYTLTQAEFKRLLGISDPQGVLTVSAAGEGITICMMQEG
jgi:ATP-dependent 26S proteasome regulatory subunit